MPEAQHNWRAQLPEWNDCNTQDLQEAYIRNLTSEACGHAFGGVVSLHDFRPTYEVPGRRIDGTRVGEGRAMRAAVAVFVPLRNVLLSLIGIVIGGLMGDPQMVTSTRFHRIQGREGCQALAFAEPVAPTPWTIEIDPLWIVWSPHQAALCKLIDDDPAQLTVLWAARTPHTVPQVDVHARTLTWHDRSVVGLDKAKAFSLSFTDPSPH